MNYDEVQASTQCTKHNRIMSSPIGGLDMQHLLLDIAVLWPGATQRRQAGVHCTVSKCTAKGEGIGECGVSTTTSCTFSGTVCSVQYIQQNLGGLKATKEQQQGQRNMKRHKGTHPGCILEQVLHHINLNLREGFVL